MADDDTDINNAISAQLEQLRSEGKLTIKPGKRCRICRDEGVRKLVNTLLAHGTTVRSIADLVNQANINDGRGKEVITYDVIWYHSRNHFDIQAPAVKVYQEILERRAAEDGKDIREAVGTAVNAMSYLETMMVKGYATMTDEYTRVTAKEGADAAVKLHEMTREDAGIQERAEIMRKMNFVISAVMSVVPESYHPAILARLEGHNQEATIALAERDDAEEDAEKVEEFDPLSGAKFDDDED